MQRALHDALHCCIPLHSVASGHRCTVAKMWVISSVGNPHFATHQCNRCKTKKGTVMARRGRRAKLVGEIPVGDVTILASNGTVYLFRLNDRSTNEWNSLKLVFAGRREHKANFSFGWNGERFSKCHDMDVMTEHYPELVGFVSEVVREKLQ